MRAYELRHLFADIRSGYPGISAFGYVDIFRFHPDNIGRLPDDLPLPVRDIPVHAGIHHIRDGNRLLRRYQIGLAAYHLGKDLVSRHFQRIYDDRGPGG